MKEGPLWRNSPMKTWIRGGRILTPDRSIEDSVLVVTDGRITAIEAGGQVAENPPDTRIIDANGLWVAPGLIDVHVHGGAGSDVMDATPEALHHMARFFIRQGVTAYLATTITNSPEAIHNAIENVAHSSQVEDGAQHLGVHLEGPYLCETFRGAQPAKWLRTPDPAEYLPWFESGAVRLITAAPELPGVLECIRGGIRRGIRFSAGHTDANYIQVERAADEGLSQATHTFNGMKGLHHREPGAAGAVLVDERIYAEVIADGVHVHPAVFHLIVRAKGVERTILVTDAMRAAGLEDGQYDLGGQMVTVREGTARTATGGLAGSTLTLNLAVRNAMQFAGLSLNQALSMATTTPAAALGFSGRKGVIQPGADADIIFIDPDLNVKAAMVSGRMIDFFQTQERT